MKSSMLASVAALVSLVACDRGPTEPARNSALAISTAPGSAFKTYDDELVDLAERLPGFGGVYFDSTGQLAVRLKDINRLEEARLKLREFFLAQSAGSAALADRRIGQLGDLKAVPATYDFVELRSWYRTLRDPILALDLVTMSDIDERRNRIFIGVADSLGLEMVETALQQVRAPREAIIVDIFPRFQAEASLQGLIRPVVAGVQVVWYGTFWCTVGYTVTRLLAGGGQDSDWYFVTNSHCTSAPWQMNGHSMGQPTANDVIKTEVADPQLFNSSADPNCPSGRQCRYCDAALVKYSTSAWTHGVIAWPAESGSLEFFETVLVSGEASPLAGDVVYKVGRTTGRSAGWAQNACADVSHPTGAWLICQGIAQYTSDQGDSGSPVFTLVPGGAIAYGVHWGTVDEGPWLNWRAFSPTPNWQSELGSSLGGTLHVTANWAPPPAVSINGYSYLPPGASCTWTADASGGVPPYTSYEWSGLLSGSGHQITGVVWESGLLRLTVTDRAGHTGESYLWITIDPGAPAPPDCWE